MKACQPPSGEGDPEAPAAARRAMRRVIPAGQPTRGKTAPNRLRRVDQFLIGYDPHLIARNDGPFADAWFLDLGFGEGPVTTLESAKRLRRLNPSLGVLGVEIDPERVTAAQPWEEGRTLFRLGGFNLPVGADPSLPARAARLVRAFNVLRQYDEGAVREAYAHLGLGVIPGGLLMEGTSDPFGRLWAANLLRRLRVAPTAWPWRLEALVFSLRPGHGDQPELLQSVLPKSLIHRVVPGEPIHAFFTDWIRAAREASPWRTFGARQWFAATLRRLAERGYRLDLRAKWLRHGFVVWRAPPIDC